MSARFICEAIEPVAESQDISAGARGEPALPMRFRWRGQEYAVATLLDKWKETGPCKSGGGEQYLRKHCYKVRTTSGEVMKIFFERQARSVRERKKRWWLSTIETESASAPEDATRAAGPQTI